MGENKKIFHHSLNFVFPDQLKENPTQCTRVQKRCSLIMSETFVNNNFSLRKHFQSVTFQQQITTNRPRKQQPSIHP